MRIALAQLNPKTGDISGNEAKVIEAIERAKKEKADIIVTPEMVIPGYCIADLIYDKAFLAANVEAVNRIAQHTNGIAAVVGYVSYDPSEKNEDGTMRKYNSAAVLQGGRTAGVASKTCLANYRYFDDKRYFHPALFRGPIDIGVKVGVSVCEDMWSDPYENKPVEELVEKGAEIVLNINASPFFPGKRAIRDGIIRGHIRKTGKPFIYVNTAGTGDNGKNIIPFEGQSLAYDGFGNLVGIGKQFEEDMFFVDLDLAKPGNPVELPPVEREKEIYDALVMSLRDYAQKTGFRRAIVPVSGGIDSAVVAGIAADAFKPDNLVFYNLPSPFNSSTTRSIAERIAHNIGAEYKVVPIGDIDETVKRAFEQNAHPIKDKVARENLHARIRGMLMMLESNDTGALLLSCGNETEVGLGYSTLYGDMCGGLSVIGDLSKMDVYNIGRYINKRYGREIIPGETFTIKPSAELSEGQYDPFDYFVVAPLVGEMVEKRRSPREIVSLFKRKELDPERFAPDLQGKTVYDKHDEQTFEELVYSTYRQLTRSVYKRLQGPPIIAVSERAFGFDLREPIMNGWYGK